MINLFPKKYLKPIKTTKEGVATTIENIFKNMENRMIGQSKIAFKRRRLEAKKNRKPNPIEIE